MSSRCGQLLWQLFDNTLRRNHAGVGREHRAVETMPRIGWYPAGRRAQPRLVRPGVHDAGAGLIQLPLTLKQKARPSQR